MRFTLFQNDCHSDTLFLFKSFPDASDQNLEKYVSFERETRSDLNKSVNSGHFGIRPMKHEDV